MDLKGLDKHIQKIALFIVLWLTASEILGLEIEKLC